MAKAQQNTNAARPAANREKVSVKSMSGWLKKALRNDRKKNLTAEQLLLRLDYKSNILSRTKDSRLKELRQKIEQETTVQSRASELYEQYKNAGVKWSACVQAIRTDWVPQFTQKWNERSSALKAAGKLK